jgi:protein tyrosine/serine phosphatase
VRQLAALPPHAEPSIRWWPAGIVRPRNRIGLLRLIRDLPTTALPAPPLDPAKRRWAERNMSLVDHGCLRLIYSNRHSAQPGRRALRWAHANGIRTILNLRGERLDCGTYLTERDECQELGLRLVNFPIRSRGMPEPETAHAMASVFEHLEYPVLMHCKSGADRAGLMSTLYLHLHKGEPMAVAMRQLSLRYGHVRYARTGMLDFFMERYWADTGGDRTQFRHWVDEVYDRDAFIKGFQASSTASFLVDKILRRE